MNQQPYLSQTSDPIQNNSLNDGAGCNSVSTSLVLGPLVSGLILTHGNAFNSLGNLIGASNNAFNSLSNAGLNQIRKRNLRDLSCAGIAGCEVPFVGQSHLNSNPLRNRNNNKQIKMPKFNLTPIALPPYCTNINIITFTINCINN